jgi:hypothetical protein
LLAAAAAADQAADLARGGAEARSGVRVAVGEGGEIRHDLGAAGRQGHEVRDVEDCLGVVAAD